jgi:hypothetical protein
VYYDVWMRRLGYGGLQAQPKFRFLRSIGMFDMLVYVAKRYVNL